MQTLEELVKIIKESSPDPGQCMVSFSGGKDAWNTWLALQPHFRTTCYAYYLVPGLKHVDSYLDKCEERTGKIYRYPSPRFYERLNLLYYQPPERVPYIQATGGLAQFDFDVISRCCEISAGLPQNTWTAIGVRAADSIMRASAIKTHGAYNPKRRVFYPIWNYRKDRLITELKRANIRLSREYLAYGRSFDGLFLLYALQLRNNFPHDYQRVLEFFPFVELEIFRYESAIRHYGGVDKLPKPTFDGGEQSQAVESQFNFGFSFSQKSEQAKQKNKYSKLNAETKKTDAKMQSMINPEFWLSVYFPDKSRFQVVFEDQGQKDHFLTKTKLMSHGDKYIDGAFLAQHLDVNIKGVPAYQRFSFGPKVDLPENPFANVPVTGDPMVDSYAELEALRKSFPEAPKLKGSQAEKFLVKAEWHKFARNGNIWGHDLAAKLRIKLPATTYFYRPAPKSDPKLEALVAD